VRAGLLLVALAGLGADGALALAGEARVWALGTVPVLGVLVVEIVTGLRRGEYGLDVVAALSMAAALVFGETLAAAMVALMYAGQYLESFSEARARREMTALLARVPRTAMRHRDGRLEEVAWSRGSACRSRGWWWRPREPSPR
jgi:cation transport ATPase